MPNIAAGNITPMCFLIQTTSADHKVQLAAGGTVPIVGVSGPGTRNIPFSSLDDGYHAIAGENVEVLRPPNKEAQLQLGGTVTPGDLLTSDASGFGVTATTGQYAGARAVEAGTSGKIVTVQLIDTHLV